MSAQIEAGYALLRQQRIEDAVRLSEQLTATYPGRIDALVFASDARLAFDDAEAALLLIGRALALAPEDLQLLQRKAHVLMALMRRPEARAVATEIAALGRSDPHALWMAGRIHNRCDDPQGAAAYFTQAIAAGASDPGLLHDLASVQFFLGQFERAEQNLDTVIATVGDSGAAIYLRSILRPQTPQRNHVADLEARLRAGIDQPSDAAACWYALGKELEDMGRWQDALAAMSRGAAIKRRTFAYSIDAELQALDGMRRTFDAPAMERLDSRHATEVSAIFVVGMPRTGTTLVERILNRHPGAVSVGELPYFAGALTTAAAQRMRRSGETSGIEAALRIDYAALGRIYAEGAARAALSEGITVDKMPVNFLYCGLIKRALPNARIVHLTRDPMDTCFAVYKTLFKQAYYFSYDFRELAAYYGAYRRLMAHWHAVVPGKILDVRYEDLVTDPEREARRLLAWCGLPWDPAVLSAEQDVTPSTTASAAQVRGPFSAASIGKWRRFGEGLTPLRFALSEVGVEVE